MIKFHVCSKQVQKDSSPEDEEEEQASPLREVRTTIRCRWHQDVGRGPVALRGISKKMKVAAAQRVVMSLRCSLVGDHLDG